MRHRVTYGQLRTVLTELGFKEIRRKNGVALERKKSDILFLLRPYEDDDRITPAELFLVTQMLDDRGLLEPESFETLLTRAPA
jgi:hypothetical protein